MLHLKTMGDLFKLDYHQLLIFKSKVVRLSEKAAIQSFRNQQ